MARDFSMPASVPRPHSPHSAREVLVGNLGRDPWEGIEKLRQVGEQKAQAEGVAYQMEKEREVVLARIATELANVHADQHLSEAKLDRLAKADPRYGAHLKATAVAIEKRELATSDFWALKSELTWDEAAMYHYNALTKLGG